MTVFHILDHNGKRIFQRSDASEFLHYCDSYSFEGVFPMEGHPFEVGQMIAWQDDDALWEVHEISTVAMDAFGTSVEISGTHIAVSELGGQIIETMSVGWNPDLGEDQNDDGKPIKEAVEKILGEVDGWEIGTLPAEASDDEMQRERYKIKASSIKLYAAMDTASKRIATYYKNKYMSPIAKPSEMWWQMQGADGRIGYVYNPNGTLVRDGNADDDEHAVLIKENKWNSAWENLQDCANQTGYFFSPRITLDNSGITGRFIDIKGGKPEYRGVRLTCSTNITEGAVKYDISNTYTALIGVGAEERTFKNIAWKTEDGYPVDKPAGQIYVSIPTALEEYGHNGIHRMGVVVFDNVVNSKTLLKKTYDKLLDHCAPDVTIDGTIADLYALGYGGQSMRMHDAVYVIIKNLGIRLEKRITALTRDLVNPEKTRPVIGSLNNDDIIGKLSGGYQ